MDILSNMILRAFDSLVMPLLLPFILIAVLLMIAGRKPDAALDAGFALFGMIATGMIKLAGAIFTALLSALKPKSSKTQPRRSYSSKRPGSHS